MKRAYIKPDMYIENFSLSQTVAAGGCGAAENSTLGSPGISSLNTCGWKMGNETVWVGGKVCTFPGPTTGEFRGVCYNNPGGGVSIFGLS